MAINPMLTTSVHGSTVREIKFRCYQGHGSNEKGWKGLKYTRKMIQWEELSYKTSMYDFLKILSHDKSLDRIIMQYTGLKDKNGKEIYEGDILENPNYPKDEWERCEVKWHGEFARFGLDFYSPYGGEGYTGREQHIDRFVSEVGCYVIGNIYENPELLNGGVSR